MDEQRKRFRLSQRLDTALAICAAGFLFGLIALYHSYQAGELFLSAVNALGVGAMLSVLVLAGLTWKMRRANAELWAIVLEQDRRLCFAAQVIRKQMEQIGEQVIQK